MNDLRENNPESWLETIWHALGCYREDCIPEGENAYDQEWNEICTAMAWIREELGLPDEAEKDQAANRTFTVTLDVIGRYRVLINAPDQDQAIERALTAMDRGRAKITWIDDNIDAVDVIEGP